MDFTLDVSAPDTLARALIPGTRRPCIFVPGEFSEALVGSVHRLFLHFSDHRFQTQVRVMWFAPPTVIEPFVPGVGLSIILEHTVLTEMHAQSLHQRAQSPTPSLLQWRLEEVHDRLTLPSRLH